VRVEAPARLHLGFYRLCSPLAPIRLGGVGVAVDLEELATIVELEVGEELAVSAPPQCLQEVEAAARAAARRYSVRGRVSVEQCLPRHVGLGSTTQLVLSVYAAFAAAVGASLEDAAAASGRGFYSGVGVGVFLRGGLVVDTGVLEGRATAYPMTWTWPPRWGVVVAVPDVDRGRLVPEGQKEAMSLESVLGEPGCGDTEGYVILLDTVLAGAALGDYSLFTRGIEFLEKHTARIFAGQQGGGAFCCPESEEAAEALRGIGARGVGQSSWGPTVYGFFPDTSSAVTAAAQLRGILGGGYRVAAGAVRRSGARLHVLS